MAGLTPVDDKNLDGYGAPIIPWDTARELLETIWKEQGTGKAGLGTHWLATVDADGMPHVVPVGAFWDEGAFYFTSGEGTRKSRNLARNARCNITLSGDGLDLVVEGEAEKVKDQSTLKRLAQIAREGGWPATVEDGALTAPFSAPSAGPAPWELYRVRPTTIYGLGNSETNPGATRWRF